jgi:hypothetical protein
LKVTVISVPEVFVVTEETVGAVMSSWIICHGYSTLAASFPKVLGIAALVVIMFAAGVYFVKPQFC